MRTNPSSFQGLEEEGLKILSRVGKELELPIVSEITAIEQFELFEQYVDIYLVGMRNMFNYPLLKVLANTKKPIILKRNFSAKISEWLGAYEYLIQNGNNNVILCERGIRSFDETTRNVIDLTAVSYIKNKYPNMLVFTDPSHSSGLRELVPNLSLASLFAGADGLIIEVDENPENSISDSRQTISIDTYNELSVKIKKYFN